ncbi:MAG: xanthine dehydrogenase family protein molybdopterin-binding subunit [Nitrososphaerota archaeon]|nr:xanthine dehydrogenase family protein molybdopterin-binding subunit [Nitrososphaerota archaeon]
MSKEVLVSIKRTHEVAEEYEDYKRVEDIRLMKGEGNYIDDIRNVNLAYMGIVRSPYPHATIESIDFSRAKENPDFIMGLTGTEFKELVNPPPHNPMRQVQAVHFHIAIDRVRYVGEPVAVFVARTRYSVEDIIDLVDVQYKELPIINSINESKKADVALFDDCKDNIFFRNQAKRGDAEHAIKASKYVVKGQVALKRQAGIPIEPRAVVAYYDRDLGTYEVHPTIQSEFRFRDTLAAELKTQANKVHVIVKDVGGGFGVKGGHYYPQPLLACVLSKRTGFAIKWVSTRTEDFLETCPGRDTYCSFELACDETATITALRARIEADVGVSGTFSTEIVLTVLLLPGAYKIPNLDIEGYCYVTNKVPLGPVRGAGRPEASFFIESAIDIAARQLSLDPLEFRKRNMIPSNELPYQNGAGATYDSGDYPMLLETLTKTPQYSELMKWKRTNTNSRTLAGVGMCVVVEDTGGPGFKETAKITLTGDGKIAVVTGCSPHGQGLETSLAQLASKEFGLPRDYATVYYGDTEMIPYGAGTFGSRSMSVGGSAVIEACRKAKAELLDRASKHFDIERNQLSITKGNLTRSQNGPVNIIMTLQELISRVGEVEAFSEYAPKATTFASGAHLCALLIDRETGKVKIKKYIAVDDCGVVINPVIVDGQLHGGIVHGVGGSLYEEIVYDQNGQLLSTNLMDYTIPTALETPDNIDIIHVGEPSPNTLNGAKGVGESGTIAAHPAIINALNDALRSADSKVYLYTAPVLPEAVFKALNGNTKYSRE